MNWIKSSLSFANSNCVEVTDLPDGRVGVRHSKHPDGPALSFTKAEWDAFLGGVRLGEFDRPLSGCDHHFAWRNPLGTADHHMDCTRPAHSDAENHDGKLPGSDTVVHWQTGDRRDFTGEFGGWCQATAGCVLPGGHGGRCSL